MGVCHATLKTQDISLYYETHGDPTNPPVLLMSDLGGVGQSWGPHVKRFARKYFVILPDQRGTGQSERSLDGYSTEQLAIDIAFLLDQFALAPVRVIASSTGGAIAHILALNRPELVRSLTLSSTFARFDAFTHREFAVRRKMAAERDRHTMFSAYTLFLFSPRYTRDHSEKVSAWIERAANHLDVAETGRSPQAHRHDRGP